MFEALHSPFRRSPFRPGSRPGSRGFRLKDMKCAGAAGLLRDCDYHGRRRSPYWVLLDVIPRFQEDDLRGGCSAITELNRNTEDLFWDASCYRSIFVQCTNRQASGQQHRNHARWMGSYRASPFHFFLGRTSVIPRALECLLGWEDGAVPEVPDISAPGNRRPRCIFHVIDLVPFWKKQIDSLTQMLSDSFGTNFRQMDGSEELQLESWRARDRGFSTSAVAGYRAFGNNSKEGQGYASENVKLSRSRLRFYGENVEDADMSQEREACAVGIFPNVLNRDFPLRHRHISFKLFGGVGMAASSVSSSDDPASSTASHVFYDTGIRSLGWKELIRVSTNNKPNILSELSDSQFQQDASRRYGPNGRIQRGAWHFDVVSWRGCDEIRRPKWIVCIEAIRAQPVLRAGIKTIRGSRDRSPHTRIPAPTKLGSYEPKFDALLPLQLPLRGEKYQARKTDLRDCLSKVLPVRSPPWPGALIDTEHSVSWSVHTHYPAFPQQSQTRTALYANPLSYAPF
ncbi:hypothetical protein CCUS01_08136 [Colletotrichum cuscutae]|uniref:Uncharacterized protein n=1 Tax=Colletotrichum cuscutae TaxID=1209917 RepID=A0AAI9UUM0_9PEZI|nr:hypothetical protein CCUS01_08136 [Colletotrichum cuscutae]